MGWQPKAPIGQPVAGMLISRPGQWRFTHAGSQSRGHDRRLTFQSGGLGKG